MLARANKWISDHKIFSGLAGVFVLATVTLFISSKKSTNESGNINFGDQTEINNSNVSGRDIHTNSKLNMESKQKAVFISGFARDTLDSSNSKTNLTEKKSQTESEPQIKKNTQISASYIAGRDIIINGKDQSELIKTLEFRAKKINSNLKDYYYYVGIEKFLGEFNELHKQHIEALKNNEFLLAHELLSQIHRLSFRIDSEEQEAQQIQLFGELRVQYLTELRSNGIAGGIATLYFEKDINPYDSTLHAGSVIYYNEIERNWPSFPIRKDSVRLFYKSNFLE